MEDLGDTHQYDVLCPRNEASSGDDNTKVTNAAHLYHFTFSLKQTYHLKFWFLHCLHLLYLQKYNNTHRRLLCFISHECIVYTLKFKTEFVIWIKNNAITGMKAQLSLVLLTAYQTAAVCLATHE